MKRAGYILLYALLLAGCSKNGNQQPGEQPVEIRLNAGNAGTRAPIASYGQTSFYPTIAGWESMMGLADYSVTPDWSSTTGAAIAHNAQNAAITLSPTQTYNNDKRYYTYVKSWYPQGTSFAGGVVTFSAAAMDGTQDILYSQNPGLANYPVEVYGNKFENISRPIEYWHPLTQIRIEVIRAASSDDYTTVKSIKLKNALLATGIDLVNDVPVYDPTLRTVTIYDGADISVTNVSQKVGLPVMVKPYATNQILLDVESNQVNGVYQVIATIDVDQSFKEGKAYSILLTFNNNEITANNSARIVSWKDGDAGGGNLE